MGGSDHRNASDTTGKLVEILPMICTFERLKILDVFEKSSHRKKNAHSVTQISVRRVILSETFSDLVDI
jgi:hypothetical protein